MEAWVTVDVQLGTPPLSKEVLMCIQESFPFDNHVEATMIAGSLEALLVGVEDYKKEFPEEKFSTTVLHEPAKTADGWQTTLRRLASILK